MNTSKIRSIIAVITVSSVTMSAPCTLRAQFLKQLVNTVKQTAQNRANDKTTSTTNSALDKVDPTTQTKSSTSGNPSATHDPNDTSASNLLMKSLGLMAGGGGVSAADSATAIKSFQTGNGGNGIFYQFITTITSKKSGNSRDTSSVYLAFSGNARSEMQLPMPGVKVKLTTLAHAGQPGYSLILDPDDKMYSLMVIDTGLINSGRESYKITRIGSETVQGFSCTHVKIVSTMGSGLFKSSTTMDLWTSPDVPGYSFMKKMEAAQNLKPGMMQALENAGCAGFMVKMESSGKDYSMTMLLEKNEQKSFPDSYFRIPDGYTESKQNLLFQGLMSGASKTQSGSNASQK